jgi:hypothetical protein
MTSGSFKWATSQTVQYISYHKKLCKTFQRPWLVANVSIIRPYAPFTTADRRVTLIEQLGMWMQEYEVFTEQVGVETICGEYLGATSELLVETQVIYAAAEDFTLLDEIVEVGEALVALFGVSDLHYHS